METYFHENYEKLRLHMKSGKDDYGLRECQMGAYWATLAHFTSSQAPALISLPTGAGKTALMILLAFGLRAKRILIIEPVVILRDQTAKKFTTFEDLLKANAVPKRIPKPKVYTQIGRIIIPRMWEQLRDYDVVVATPHTTSPEQRPDIKKAPADLFDVVFFDEAHHTPARTWDALLRVFKDSKCILLTAMPFRQDRRKVRARPIYNYPLGRAISRGIYQPIKYHPVSSKSWQEKDSLLCKRAKLLLNIETKYSRRTKLLIRTDRVKKCKQLIGLYDKLGLHVAEVNYQRSMEDNESVLEDLKHDKLDGVICVGMLGEGLDIPELKIAVFHNPPKSFPFTLQFVGRLSRPIKGDLGDARVVASPDDVKGRMRKLYRQNASWRDLIPKLADSAVGKVGRHDMLHRIGSVTGDLDIVPKKSIPFLVLVCML